jgi:hypothetical protein
MATKKPIHAVATDKRIIAWSAPVEIKAACDDDEEHKKDMPASFAVTAYKGGAMEVEGWDQPVVIDLKGMQFSKSVIANLGHDNDKFVGHVTAKEKTESTVQLDGLFSAETSSRDTVVKSAANGFPWEASVEVTPARKGIEEVDAGKVVKANGQEFTGPLYVARKSTLSGFGFVLRGADPDTVVSIAAKAASTKENEMVEKLKAFIEAMLPGVDIDTLSEEAVANLKADMDGKAGKRIAAGVKTGNPFDVRRAEAKRRGDIRDIADNHIKARRCEDRGDQDEIDAVEKMYDHAIESRMSTQDFRLAIYESSVPDAQTVFSPKQRDPGINGKVLEAAIALHGNLPAKSLDATYDDKTLQTAKDRFPNGIGLKQLWRMAAKANGHQYDGDDVTAEMQQFAFRKQLQGIRAAGGYSTYDLAAVLANTANKFLLEGWGMGEMAWSRITDIANVRDFKTNTFFKLTGSLKYKKILPGGQIEHGQVATGSYTTQAETYGIMFAIDRTAIINDDLSVITRVPLEMGYGANDAFNEVFWTEFMDNASFFASGNANLATGVLSTPATAVATVAAAEGVFMAQTKPNGTPLGILPTIMLVPPLAKRSALGLVSSTTVTGSTGPLPTNNTFQGEYEVVATAYTASTAITGNSAIKWWLLANRPGFSTMLTAFLFGRQSPTVETSDMVFNTLGVQMRGYHDFGTNKMEYRAGVQGSGA